jgi:L-malate glycosyltransferase
LIKVLHITPHLGGGVGRALLSLCTASVKNKDRNISHAVVCIEPLEKDEFVREIQSLGISVLVNPSILDLQLMIESTDVVQLEWWNHPLMPYSNAVTNLVPSIRIGKYSYS